MRERERECARARSRSPVCDLAVVDRDLQSAISSPRPRSPVRDPAPSLIAISSPRSRDAVDRDLAKIVISPSIAISPSQDRTRSRSRSTARTCKDHDLAFARSRSRRRSRSRIAIDGAVVGRCSVSSLMIFSWVVACVFLDLCFTYSFLNTRK